MIEYIKNIDAIPGLRDSIGILLMTARKFKATGEGKRLVFTSIGKERAQITVEIEPAPVPKKQALEMLVVDERAKPYAPVSGWVL